VLAVTAATGQLGSRVARRLADRGIEQRLVVRDPTRLPELPGSQAIAADYADGPAMRAALSGVDTMLFISATEHADRAAMHTLAVDAAVQAGVRRIVYVSFLGAAQHATFTFARDHWHTEQHIAAAGVAYTFLRDSLYQDVFPYFVGADGVLRGPAGAGRVAAVSRDDVADVAVEVLLHDDHGGQTYDVTGPVAFTMAQAAQDMSIAADRPIRYDAETLDQAYASRAVFHAPDWAVAGWVTSYAAVATGEMDVVSDTVERLTGRPPMTSATWLAHNPDAVARLRRLGSASSH
jgi:uncharacterized protein YbjT (DUF2867 family)